MDSKKEIFDEMKKFNRDLEKHLPNLDLDFIKDFSPGKNDRGSESDEYFSLLANNLMELRTEVALTRKNLTTEIEGMVLRTINSQQNKFFEQIKKFYGVIIMELKDNFSGHLSTLNEEINNIKRKQNETFVQGENLIGVLDEMTIDIKDLRNQLDDVRADTRQINIVSKKKFDDFFEKLDTVTNDINRKKTYFEENLGKINKKFTRIEGMIEDLKLDIHSGVSISASREIEENEADFEFSPQYLQNLRDNSSGKINDEREEKKFSQLQAGKSSRYDRLMDINEKLEKLNSLR